VPDGARVTAAVHEIAGGSSLVKFGATLRKILWGAKTWVTSLTRVFARRGSAVRLPEIGSQVAIGDAVTSSENPGGQTNSPRSGADGDVGHPRARASIAAASLQRESAVHRSDRV
jgi:hypothetical protein